MNQVSSFSGCVRRLIFCLLLGWAWIIISPVPSIGSQDNSTDPRHYCEYTPPAGKGNGKTIVLLSGDEEYRSEELMPMLGQVLSQRHGFHCYVLFAIDPQTGEIDPNNQSNLPGLQFLEQADLVIMAWRFRNPPDDQMQFFVDYLTSGRPIIALRTSTHAFNFKRDSKYHRFSFNSSDWTGGFGQQILGETWVSHHGNHGTESTRGVVVPEFAGHPILAGVKHVWGPSDVYGIRSLPEDATVIMRGQVLKGMEPASQPADKDPRNEPMMPLVWVRELTAPDREAVQRIVATTMGAATDFEVGDLNRLLVNSVYWSLGWEDQIKPDFEVQPIEPFKPSPFGFNTFKKGLKPADFNLVPTPGKQGSSDNSGADGEQASTEPGLGNEVPGHEVPGHEAAGIAARISGTEAGWRAMTDADFVNCNCEPDTWTWREDGVIVCTGQPVGVIRSVQEYQNFELMVEWQHQKEAGNSGVFVWSPRKSLDGLKPGQLPQGIECQVLDHGYTKAYEAGSGNKADWFTTDGDVFPCAGSKMKPFPPIAPDGVRSFPSSNHSKGFGQWNHYYIRAINGEVRLWVNGVEVSGGTDCEPASGHVALESEGSPILFRNLRIRELN